MMGFPIICDVLLLVYRDNIILKNHENKVSEIEGVAILHRIDTSL